MEVEEVVEVDAVVVVVVEVVEAVGEGVEGLQRGREVLASAVVGGFAVACGSIPGPVVGVAVGSSSGDVGREAKGRQGNRTG